MEITGFELHVKVQTGSVSETSGALQSMKKNLNTR